jgi:hypothetical protein
VSDDRKVYQVRIEHQVFCFARGDQEAADLAMTYCHETDPMKVRVSVAQFVHLTEVELSDICWSSESSEHLADISVREAFEALKGTHR